MADIAVSRQRGESTWRPLIENFADTTGTDCPTSGLATSSSGVPLNRPRAAAAARADTWSLRSDPVHLSQVQVYVVHLASVGASTSQALRAACQADELGQAEKFVLPARRQQFVLTRGVLRILLATRVGLPPGDVPLRRDPCGKLRLAAGCGNVRFNVSHSSGLALIALAVDREVGIDVEACDPQLDVDAIVHRFYPRAEAEQLAALPPAGRRVAFFRSWTRKEAWLKAAGTGLRSPIASVPTPPGDEAVVQTGSMQGWILADLEVAPGYAAAVVARGTSATG